MDQSVFIERRFGFFISVAFIDSVLGAAFAKQTERNTFFAACQLRERARQYYAFR